MELEDWTNQNTTEFHAELLHEFPVSSDKDQQDGSLHLAKYFPRQSELKSMSLASAYALIAAQEAIEHSQVAHHLFSLHFLFLIRLLVALDVDRSHPRWRVDGQRTGWSRQYMCRVGSNKNERNLSWNGPVLHHSSATEYFRWIRIDPT